MSQAYTLKIGIDDSKIKDLEKRLLNITSGGKTGSNIIGSTTNGDKGNIVKNIGKLAFIASGVLALVGFVKKLMEMTINASPMLQQMLKLFNFGVLLLLRPIGDFFGFFLKPIMIYFLRNIALPWFNLARPFLSKAGARAGTEFAKNPLDFLGKNGFFGVAGLLATHLGEINDALDGQGQVIKLSIEKVINGFDIPNISNRIKTTLLKWISDVKSGLIDFSGRINAFIKRWINRLMPKLPSWDTITTTVTTWMASLKLPSWDDVIKIFTDLKNTLSGIGDLIGGVIDAILEAFGLKQKENNNNGNNSNNGTVINDPTFNINGSIDSAGDYLTDIFNGFADKLKGSGF